MEEGYLEKEDIAEMEDVKDPECVDYGMLYNKKMAVLKKAADHMPFVRPSDYDAFLIENAFWLKDYAIFMAIKEENNGKAWQDWPEELRDHVSFNPEAEVVAQEFIEPAGVIAFGLQEEYPLAAEIPEGVAFRILPGGIAVSNEFREEQVSAAQVVPDSTISN